LALHSAWRRFPQEVGGHYLYQNRGLNGFKQRFLDFSAGMWNKSCIFAAQSAALTNEQLI
jgi:hypothetical protein